MKKTSLFPLFLLAAALFSTLLVAFTLPGNPLSRPMAQHGELAEFLAQFPHGSLPYTFGEDAIQARLRNLTQPLPEEKDSLMAAPSIVNMSFVRKQKAFKKDQKRLEYGQGKFRRNPVSHEPVARFETAQHYAAVVIARDGQPMPGFGNYEIVVFDKKGRLVGINNVGRVHPLEARTFTIDTSLQATIRHFTVEWESEHVNFKNNRVKGLKMTGEKRIDLTNNKVVKSPSN